MKIQHKTTILAQAISLSLTCAILCQTSFAMQALEDEHLENITGEGIALVIEDFNLRWNGIDNEAGTGYARLIPVGSLSKMIQDHNDPSATDHDAAKRAKYDTKIGKGDVYLYGLSISKNDGNANTQFNTDENTNKVDIGSADNPWLFMTKTVTVPNFNGESKSLTYMGFEAPLFTNLVNVASGESDPNSYDLKLGLWADAFVRDPNFAEGEEGEFWLNGRANDGHRFINGVDATAGTTLRENRLRLQAIINGISLNGTNLKIFQTLDGAENAGNGLGASYSHYNNTLGLALTARINSGDATSVRAPLYSEEYEDETVSDAGGWGSWSNFHGGWSSSLNAAQSGGNCGNSGSVTNAITSTGGCQFMLQSRTRTDTKTRTVTKTSTWSNTGLSNDHVMRISTREKGTVQGVLDTPAINGGGIPEFAESEGIYLYNPNINLVLGSQWQPLILGVAPDGSNFSLELTRIPNVANVYKEIYTDYTGADASYKGGTCSIYWCGGDGNGISKNATHSSITIGTTNAYSNGSLTAYTGADALGVSFGDLAAVDGQSVTNTGSTTSTATATQVQWIQRTNNSATTWNYRRNALGSTRTGTANQWSYNGTVVGALTGVTNAPSALATRYSYPVSSGTGNTWYTGSTQGLCGDSNCTYYGTTNNRNWTYTDRKGLSWSEAENATLNTWLADQGSLARSGTIANQAATPTLPSVAQPSFGGTSPVNLGSAVIDGLLIQHMKITTKGL